MTEFSCLFGCFPFAVRGPKLQWTEWNHIAWKPASKTARAGPDWKSQISLGSQNPGAAEVSYFTEQVGSGQNDSCHQAMTTPQYTEV